MCLISLQYQSIKIQAGINIELEIKMEARLLAS